MSGHPVLARLQRLKPDKSPGLDGIHPMLLKSCAHQVAKPLSLIYQASFDEGQLPSDWKLANISPFFKKGPNNNPGNYRPVSLTSVPCKLMERDIDRSPTGPLRYQPHHQCQATQIHMRTILSHKSVGNT